MQSRFRFAPWKTCIILLVLVLYSASTLAVEPLRVHYESYTYDYWGKPITAPQAYVPALVVTGIRIGVGNLNNPRDMVVLEDRAFIVDTGNNRIIEVDEDWRLVRIIDGFSTPDGFDKLREPEGIFIADDGYMYIADTGNGRIVILDENGSLVGIIGSPYHEYPDLFPAIYRPRKVAVDSAGRVYIIAQDIYDGIIVTDISGKFRGFIGAPRIKPSPVEIFWSKIASDEQRKRALIYLPIEFSNISIDSEGFIYAVVAGPADNEAIKRLTPSGVDIIVRNGYHPMVGDLTKYLNIDEGTEASSRFVDIVGRSNGMFSVLDRSRGRVFTYDNQGNLLYVFGALGNAAGLFTRPIALDTRGDRIVVLDADGKITVFRPTEYALLIHAALEHYHEGDYQRSTEIWQELTMINPNLDVAHIGIGRAMFYTHEYEKAMESFLHGQYRIGYSQAYAKYRQEYINDNFAKIAGFAVLLALLVYFTGKYQLWRRLKQRIGGLLKKAWGEAEATVVYCGIPIRNPHTRKARLLQVLDSLNYVRHVIFHPFDGFWDLKHEKRGSMAAATVIIVATALAWMFYRQYEAFIFNDRRVDSLNIFFEAASILLPVFLWTMVNWALTTLMEGKGTYQDIYIATAFALVPLAAALILTTLLSHFLIDAEGAFLQLAWGAALVWTLGLVLIGTMVTHEYSGTKTLATSAATIAGIAAVLFISLLFVSLVNQVIGFVYKIYLELAFR